MCSLAMLSSLRPTSVEPVKESLRTRGSASIAATTSPDFRLGSTLTTPAGTPASSIRAAMARAVSGVSPAGLRIVVQPAARAGAILRAAIAAGKFHGVTRTAMPTGWRITMILLAPLGAVWISPRIRTASSAYQRKNSAEYTTSPRASGRALPFSALISTARSSARSIISWYVRDRISDRFRGAVAAHSAAASAAASTQASASSTVPLATEVSASPVAGSSTSKVAPSEAGRCFPPMINPVGTPRTTSATSAAMFALTGTASVRRAARRTPSEPAACCPVRTPPGPVRPTRRRSRRSVPWRRP